jgi:putative transposase
MKAIESLPGNKPVHGGLPPAQIRRETMALEDKGRRAPAPTQDVALLSGGEDLLRRLLGELVQDALEKEFERFVGAGRWQRSESRRGWRNGYKRRRLRTRVGTLELRIPKDREGEFQPSLFARYQRSEKALVLALVEMYIQGVSTRKVTRVVEELCGFRVSASQVSGLVKKLDTELAAWRDRSLSDSAYPYLVVDAHYEKVRRDGRVRSTAVLWVMGVREDGYREHLGVWLGSTESQSTWSRVFQDLLGRGLRGVRYIVSDEHSGLRDALTRAFPGAAHQRCQVHYLRNLLGQCTSVERFAEVKGKLQDVWDSPTREIADQKLKVLLNELEEKQPRLASWLEESVEETLAFFELPTPTEQKRLRTTNGLEHEHSEIRRRTRVIRIFPNDESLVRLASALAIERNEQWSMRRYLLISPEARLDRTWTRIRHSAA